VTQYRVVNKTFQFCGKILHESDNLGHIFNGVYPIFGSAKWGLYSLNRDTLDRPSRHYLKNMSAFHICGIAAENFLDSITPV
jgi:hypothetical protein